MLNFEIYIFEVSQWLSSKMAAEMYHYEFTTKEQKKNMMSEIKQVLCVFDAAFIM